MTVPTTEDSQLPDRRALWAARESMFAPELRDLPTKRPNVVFILADDLGWGDLGSYGSLHNSTPALDRLAADGLRFTHGYAASDTCSPTRIALYTGRFPGRLEAGLQEPIVRRDARTGIPEDHPTLPSLLRGAGYRASMVGKWHCGWLPWFSPLRIGFESFYGCFDGAVDYFSHIDTAGQPDLWEDETPIEELGYLTSLISERAARYIHEQAASQGSDDGNESRQPFYLQVNFTAPHWPWEGPEDQAVSDRVTSRAAEGSPIEALFHFEGGSLDAYRTMVEALDLGVGEILDALKDSGVADDTIVVFTSDNGGERYAFQWPFVGEKGDLEEGGIRVPLIVRWPGVVDAGTVTDVPVSTLDLTATLVEVGGASEAESHPLDGASLASWLSGAAPAPTRDLFWRTEDQGALRRGNYKLLVDRVAKPLWGGAFGKEGERVRLFDVSVDGREHADLSGEDPEAADDLYREWHKLDQDLLPYDALTAIVKERAGISD